MPIRCITAKQQKEIVHLYKQGYSLYQIQNMTGISRGTADRTLHQYGIQMRGPRERNTRLALNEHAFSKRTPTSAYWIGFLMADGNVMKKGKMSPLIRVHLKAGDIDHVYKLRAFLKSEHKVYIEPPSKMHCKTNGKTYMSSGAVLFCVRSDQLATDLARYGVMPNKSLTSRVHHLQNNRHFWRGVVDGDGHICLQGNCPRVDLTGSKPLLQQFLRFVKTIHDGHVIAVVRDKPNQNDCALRFSGPTARSIIHVLYGNAPDYLDRKMEIANNIMSLAA